MAAGVAARRVLAGVVLTGVVLAGVVLAAGGGPVAAAGTASGAVSRSRPVSSPVSSSVLFTFQEDDVYESSGLVDRGGVVYTVNDSGDDAVLYGIDPGSGRTVSRTTYADGVDDVEALAPGAAGTVWVGDIGDNRRGRETVSVYRVVPRDGVHAGARFDLTYPDGAHDAETLLVRPSTGRLMVVTKSVFGGRVYLAPRKLRPPPARNRLRPVAQVPGLVTDGAFLPDGDHVVLRGYGTATGFAFPSFSALGTVDLPEQRQGEAISVSPAGRVLVSTEGVATQVLRVRLPRALVATPGTSGPGTTGPGTTGPGPASGRAGGPGPAREPEEAGGSVRPRGAGDWAGITLVALAVAGLGWLTLRGASGPGSRRS